jgi:hypothetical protein
MGAADEAVLNKVLNPFNFNHKKQSSVSPSLVSRVLFKVQIEIKALDIFSKLFDLEFFYRIYAFIC